MDRTCGQCEGEVECIHQGPFSPSWHFVLLAEIWLFVYDIYVCVVYLSTLSRAQII